MRGQILVWPPPSPPTMVTLAERPTCQLLGIHRPPAPRNHSTVFSEAPVNNLATHVLPCLADKLWLSPHLEQFT